MKNRMLMFLLVLALGLSMLSTAALAERSVDAVSSATDDPATGEDIQEISYNGKGVVEVDFSRHVRYKDLKVTVKDENDVAYTVKITKRDNDTVRFLINKYQAGLDYAFELSGVRMKGETDYKTLSGSVYIPGVDEVLIESVGWDLEDSELDVEFVGLVRWDKSPSVTVVDDDTQKELSVKVKKHDKDSIKVRVERGALRVDGNYTVTVSGVKAWDGVQFTQVTDSFQISSIDD